MKPEVNWKLNNIYEILPEEFYELIDRNRDHIEKTFPVTLFNCSTLEQTINYFETAQDNQEHKEDFYFYIRNMQTNNLIGYVVVKNIELKVLKCELAYFVDKDFEGQGIVTKAVKDTLMFCFNELDMNKVTICTSPVNAASQRIALKHGFVQEGVLREEFRNGKGELEDVLYFGLLKKDYTQR